MSICFLNLFSDDELKLFMENMRTRYGRLTHGGKSGDPSIEHSDRDNFILRSVAFLKEHIRRCPSRSNTKGVRIITN